ncbi:MAG: transketolase C-terminal domain-containing protein, partial [Eubacteriales bacterium]|nr:transketolase C-terminal domain-containing protein [Eubacteriales bacterium]
GKGALLREGRHAVLIALGPMVEQALRAAELLEKRGCSVAVADARFVKPLDEELLSKLLSSFPEAFTLEENTLCGGFGAAVLEWAAMRGLKAQITPLAAPDRFIPHGKIAQQRKDCMLDADSIADTIHARLKNVIDL